MRILKRVLSLQRHLNTIREEGLTIGFTPTMGALHDGHMSLIRQSAKQNDVTVASIFVNPTQFNQKDDLDKYPRDIEGDVALLKKNGCNYLFAPLPSQVYPKGLITKVDLDISSLTSLMEGPNRPGHFEGVVQVVNRLLDIIGPDNLYMGQKDFQQFTVIDYMLNELKRDTRLRVVPIVREADGLAMSSRNVRLDPELRPITPIIHQTLMMAASQLSEFSIEDIESKAIEKLTIPGFKPEYFTVVDGHSLLPVKRPQDHDLIVACTAVWAGDVRLIDNKILKGEITIR